MARLARDAGMPGGLDMLGYPENGLPDLIWGSSAIVIAKVGEVDAVVTAMRWPPRTPSPLPDSPPETFDVTYYTIDVEEVIRDDGAAEAGNPLTLRIRGRVDDGSLVFPIGETGTRYLYFLQVASSGDWYGIPFGPYGRLGIDGDAVTFSDSGESVVPFAEGLSPAEFLDEVVDELHGQQTATPTQGVWLTPTPTATP